jgi:hypothetical protein
MLDGRAAVLAGIIVFSASITIIGEAIGGHLLEGLVLGGLLIGFLWAWVQLRTGRGQATPDTLALWLAFIAAFGLASPRIDVVLAWLRGG